jgi:hypothetical protein
MVKALLGGLLGRLAAYGVLGLGFWLLFRGFLLPSVVQGVLGGGLVLAGMYLMVKARRSPSVLLGKERSQLAPPPFSPVRDKEDHPGDPIHRSGQSG